MARKKKQDEGSGGAYWMDTYGDMITLVLTFFVLLFSMSTIDAAKWEALVHTLTGTPLEVVSPLNPGRSMVSEPVDQPDIQEPTPEQAILMQQEADSKLEFQELYQRIMELVSERQLESMLLVTMTEDRINLRFMDSLLFDTGKDDLREDSIEIITAVAGILEATQDAIFMIKVEGHTDNVPISTFRFRDNWDLSVARSTQVLRVVLGATTIVDEKIEASGRGETIPIDTNETAEGRARNRRVDIRIERKIIDSGYDPGALAYSPPDATLGHTEDLWEEIGGN